MSTTAAAALNATAGFAAGLRDHPLLWRLVGLAAFNLTDASGWGPAHYALWVAVIMAAMELLARLTLAWGAAAGYDAPGRRIKPGGKALDRLEAVDVTFITTSKLLTALFTYHAIRYCWTQPTVAWGRPTLASTALALPALYVVYDFFYTFFHRALHHPSVYALVHKHHHRQVVPTRGNTDAINVHPFEFVCGEYCHLLAVHLVGGGLRALAASGALPSAVAGALGLADAAVAGVHVATMWFFIVWGGVLASLNHTRFDISWGGGAFVVRYHDIHHHRYYYNYGQYIMLWDVLGGTFRAPAEDAVAAAAPSGGKPKAA
jgi:sterol desaturase/sphingolipid hydroxylase (fatty acid hydroxylase superfamily)